MTILGDKNNDNDGAATLKSGTVEEDNSSAGAVVDGGDTSTTTNERGEGGAVLLTGEQLLSMTNHMSDDEDDEVVEGNRVSAFAAARMEEKAGTDKNIPQKQQPQQQHASHGISSKKQEELQSDATSTTTFLSKKQESNADHGTTTTNMATSGGSHGNTTTTTAVLPQPTERLTATQGEYAAPGAHRIHVNSSADTAAATASTAAQEPPPIAVTATLVKPTTEEYPVEDLEARVRQQVLSEAVVAQQVAVLPEDIRDEDDASSTHRHKKSSDPITQSSSRRLWILLLVAFNVIGVATGVGVILGVLLSSREKDTPSSTAVNAETEAIDISEDDNEENDEDNDDSPPDWWIEISPDVVLPNSPQRRAYEWMTANIFGSQPFPGPKESHAYALVTFYYATGGDSSWLRNDGWLDPSIDICDWYPGTMCTDIPAGGSPGRLRQLQTGGGAKLFSNLQLPNNGLIGTIPPELFFIDSLQTLDLSGNQLTGGSTDDGDPLSTLFQSNLREVRLEGNNITGTIGPAICTPFTDVAIPQGGVLAMDCLDTTIVRCPCCTICCLNGADCQPQSPRPPSRG